MTREDPRKTAARLSYQRQSPAQRVDPEEAAQRSQVASMSGNQLRTAAVEGALQEAIRRGDFDDLPGFGKPLTGLNKADDPDWWIRDKIESEGLAGLAPPALALRKEDRELDDRLDELASPADVRETVEDFNARIVRARFQPQGGPPVITRERDVDAEVVAWRERRLVREREKRAAVAEGPVTAGREDGAPAPRATVAAASAADPSPQRSGRSWWKRLLWGRQGR